MKFYEVVAPVMFSPGALLCLTEAQEETRAHALERVGAGPADGERIFRVTAPVSFKAGELIGIDDSGGLPRSVSAVVEEVETDLDGGAEEVEA